MGLTTRALRAGSPARGGHRADRVGRRLESAGRRPGRERAEDRGAERRPVFAGMHGDRLAQHVGVDLHQQRIVMRQAAGGDELADRDAAFSSVSTIQRTPNAEPSMSAR